MKIKVQGPRTFLSRPFWRDYIVGASLIGLGFMISSPNMPIHPAIGLTMGALGVIVFVLAIVWSLIAKLFGP